MKDMSNIRCALNMISCIDQLPETHSESVRDPKVGLNSLFPSRGQKRRLVRDNPGLTWIILGFVRRVSELNVKVDVEDGVVVVVPWD